MFIIHYCNPCSFGNNRWDASSLRFGFFDVKKGPAGRLPLKAKRCPEEGLLN